MPRPPELQILSFPSASAHLPLSDASHRACGVSRVLRPHRAYSPFSFGKLFRKRTPWDRMWLAKSTGSPEGRGGAAWADREWARPDRRGARDPQLGRVRNWARGKRGRRCDGGGCGEGARPGLQFGAEAVDLGQGCLWRPGRSFGVGRADRPGRAVGRSPPSVPSAPLRSAPSPPLPFPGLGPEDRPRCAGAGRVRGGAPGARCQGSLLLPRRPRRPVPGRGGGPSANTVCRVRSVTLTAKPVAAERAARRVGVPAPGGASCLGILSACVVCLNANGSSSRIR